MPKPQSNRYGPNRLTMREHVMVEQYFANGFKKVEAVLAAGYSKRSADKRAYDLFNRPRVKAEIERRMKIVSEKAGIDEEWVIKRLKQIANAGETLARFKKVGEDGMLRWDFTGASDEDLAVVAALDHETVWKGKGKNRVQVLKFKVGTSDIKGALDSLARHLGMFNDKLEVAGEVSLVERLQAGRKRVKG